jgi:hypothetical protein
VLTQSILKYISSNGLSELIIEDPSEALSRFLLALKIREYRVVKGRLTSHWTSKLHVQVTGLSLIVKCRKCGYQDEPCQVLAGYVTNIFGSISLEPADISRAPIKNVRALTLRTGVFWRVVTEPGVSTLNKQKIYWLTCQGDDNLIPGKAFWTQNALATLVRPVFGFYPPNKLPWSKKHTSLDSHFLGSSSTKKNWISLVLYLWLALSKVYLFSPEDEDRTSFRNVVFYTYSEFRMIDKVQKPSDSEKIVSFLWKLCSIAWKMFE